MNIFAQRSSKYVSLLILFCVAIVAVAWRYACVPWTDDLQYMRLPGEDVRFWYSEGDFIKDFGDACRAIYYHHIKITSRLPNYIQCLVNLLPKLVVDISHGLMVGLLVLITAYSIAGRRMLKLTHIVGMSALALWTMLPWYDNMASSVFMLNYVWVSVFILIFFQIFLKRNFISSKYQWIQWPIVLIIGMSHEGFTFAMIAACLSILVIDKTDRRRRFRLICTLAVGALFCFMTPGIFSRLQSQVVEQSNGSLLSIIKESILQLESVWMLVVILIFVGFRRGLKYLISILKQEAIYVFVIIFSYAIAIASGTVHRGLWFTDLVAIILSFRLLVLTFKWWQSPQILIGSITSILMLISMIEVCRWQMLLSNEIKEVCRQVELTKRPIAYIDITDSRNIPWWAFDIPKSIASSYGNRSYAFHYGFNDDYTNILILPSDYRFLPIEKWSLIKGSAGLMGQYPLFFSSENIGNDLKITVGNHLPAANLLDRILCAIGSNEVSAKNISFKYYWNVALDNGDTLCAYNIDHLGRTMRNREILLIDRLNQNL